MDTNTVIAEVGIAPGKRGRRNAPRRHRSLEEKQLILAEAFAPGASVAAVARRRGVNANLVFGWRRLQEHGLLEAHTRPGKTQLLAVTVDRAATGALPDGLAALRLNFPCGVQLHVGSGAAPDLLERIIELLRR